VYLVLAYELSLNKSQREVRFFSREATHIITTRPIPPELDASSSSNTKGTVNPAQLETKKSVFDAALGQKTGNGDILYKARELGMKIWSAEKLQRMLNTMFNTELGLMDPEYLTRPVAPAAHAKPARQADLQKLLQNEKINGPLDRDYSVATQDVIPLRGYYIYIHDMDETTKPVMVREYNKVAKKEEGKWPQFRMSGVGKCPFIEDVQSVRKQQQEQEEQKARAARATARSAAAREDKRALGENNNLARRPSANADTIVKEEDAKPLDPPKVIPTKRANTDSMPAMFGSAQASIRAMPRFVGGEPVASGIQPSNITSAIRSQMISSTAAAPGARAGNSKELNQLKRKVLEKNTMPANGAGSIHDIRAALNDAPPMRAAKRKAQVALGHIHEDSDEELQRPARKVAAIRRRKTQKELKPGYCENCREKFEDFDDVRILVIHVQGMVLIGAQHCQSRRHRKFATTADNWFELDQLLAQLKRK
jgi:regulatory subunit for Cdc7p protein kinase